MNEDIYNEQLSTFISKSLTERPEFLNYYKWPILHEDSLNHAFDEHYIYHIHWALKKLAIANPTSHFDISSSLHFAVNSAIYRPTTYVDIRVPRINIDGLVCIPGDITRGIEKIGQLESVSCMHVVEHLGLGRYGDDLSVNADVKAMSNLSDIVKPGGRLLFVVPIGSPAVFFNAHRVYSAERINKIFSQQFYLKEFLFIPGNLKEFPRYGEDFASTLRYSYGCGCFEYIKHL